MWQYVPGHIDVAEKVNIQYLFHDHRILHILKQSMCSDSGSKHTNIDASMFFNHKVDDCFTVCLVGCITTNVVHIKVAIVRLNLLDQTLQLGLVPAGHHHGTAPTRVCLSQLSSQTRGGSLDKHGGSWLKLIPVEFEECWVIAHLIKIFI